MLTTLQLAANHVVMNEENANKKVSNVGTGWLVSILHEQLTRNPQFIHKVIDIVEESKPCRKLTCREVAHLQALNDAMYHAWNRIWQPDLNMKQFKCQNSGVNLAFIMLATELGTAIALRQKQFFGTLNAR